MVAGLVGFAANVAIGLWTRSTVEAVAHDVATRVASTPLEHRAEAADAAVESARRLLGAHGRRVELGVESVDPEVVLRVRSPGVSLLPRMIGPRVAVGAVDQRLVVHGERSAP